MKRFFLCLFISLVATTIAFSAQVSLQWEPSPTTSVIGYELRYSQDSATLATGEGASIVDVGNALTYELNGLGKGTWYFAVLAYNETQKSDLSNMVEYNERGIVIVENLHIEEEKPVSVQVNILFGEKQ